MNNLHVLNGLKNTYLYDSYLPNNSTKIELGEGNSNLTGANGAGKTSTLNLIPIFYGARPDRLIDRSANKLNFTDYYLPNPRSMIVFEYNTPMGLCCAVFYRNQDKQCYRFIQSSASETVFSKSSIEFHKEHQTVKSLLQEIEMKGYYVSKQIDNSLDYVAVLTNDKKRLNRDFKLRDLASIFSLSGKGHELKHIGASTQITLNKTNLLDNFKLMLVDAFLENEQMMNQRSNTLNSSSLISDIQTLREFDKEKPKLQLGIEQRRALMQTYSLLEAYRGQAIQKLEINNTTIAQLRYQRSQAIEQAKAELKVIENEIISNSSNESRAKGELEGLQHALASIEENEKNYKNQDILKKQEEFNNLAKYKQEAEDARRYVDELEKNLKEIVNKFEQLKNSALEEKDRDLAAIHEHKNEVSNLLHNLQQDRSHAVDQLALAEKNELNAFEQSKLEERKIYEDEVDHCNNLIAEAVNHTQEEQQQIEEYQLNLQALQKTMRDKEQQLNAANTHLLRLKSENTRANTDFDTAKRHLDKSTQTEHQLRDILYQKNTLLSFLKQCPDDTWKHNIAKLINPKLFLHTGLKPYWDAEQQNGTGGFYGLHLDTSKLELPVEAESLNELEQRLAQAISILQDAKEKYSSSEKAVAASAKAVQDFDLNLIKLQNELRQSRDTFDSTQRIFEQYKQTVMINVAERRTLAEGQRDQARQRLNLFNEQLNVERQMIHDRFGNEKTQIQQSYDFKIKEQLERKAMLDERSKSVVQKYNNKIIDLESLRNSELQQKGLDTAVYQKAQDQLKRLQHKCHIVKDYETILMRYKVWFEQEYSRKTGICTLIGNLEQEIYAFRQNFDKLTVKIEKLKEHSRHEVRLIERNLQQIEEENTKIASLRNRIHSVLDGIPHIEQLEVAEPVSFEWFYRNTEDHLNRQKEQLKELKQSLNTVLSILRQNSDFELYKQWENRMALLGNVNTTTYDLYGMKEIENMLLVDIPTKENLTINSFKLAAYDLRNYGQSLAKFRRKLNAISKDLTEQTNTTNPFTALGNIQIELLSVLDGLNVYEQLDRFEKDLDEESIQKSSQLILPSEKLIRSFESAVKALEKSNVQTDDIRSLVKLRISYEENNRKVYVNNDSDLLSGSSTGLSRLIVIIIFTALTRKLCPDINTVIHVPLDEIGQFDSQNTMRLFELMQKQNIYLVCAQPNLSSELSESFVHKNDIDRNFGIRKFKTQKNEKPNPLLA